MPHVMSDKRIFPPRVSANPEARWSAFGLLHGLFDDALYRNSIYLMTSTAIMAALGFVFWLVCARVYPASQIGLATTLLSVTALMASFSQLGFNNGMIRYLPSSERKQNLINTAVTFVCLPALLLPMGYVAALPLLAPRLAFLGQNPIDAGLFVALTTATALNQLLDDVFVGYRSTGYVLAKSSAQSILKLLLLFPLAALGAYGLYLASSLPVLVVCMAGGLVLAGRFQHHFAFCADRGTLRTTAKFNLATYSAAFLWSLPALVLPSVITNRLDPSSTAHFYVVSMITSLIYVIPTATSQALLAEASHEEGALKAKAARATRLIASLMVPTVVVILLYGHQVLASFGGEYAAGGYPALRWMALSGGFASMNLIANALLNVRRMVFANLIASGMYACVTVALSTALLSRGLEGLGIAWIIGQASATLFYLLILPVLVKKDRERIRLELLKP